MEKINKKNQINKINILFKYCKLLKRIKKSNENSFCYEIPISKNFDF